MITKGNFMLLEAGEFRSWLASQKITRTITKLQVHHTWRPNYSTRRGQDHFACLEGMRRSHLANGWSGTGQNVTVFEDSKIAISLDRDLNKVPAGISGANTGALCIEIIGNFDKGGDSMTDAQKRSVTHVYACLADKLNIPIDTNHIVYHAWYAASGAFLGDYTAGKSSKTCPGTNFWGDGNTKAAANKGFIPAIKQEMGRLNGEDEDKLELSNYQWQSLRNGVSELIANDKITDKTWLDKIDKRTLTVSELSWLAFTVALR